MIRPKVRQLDPSGATGGQGLVFDAASGLWVPGTVVRSVVAGSNITVDSSDPAHPVVNGAAAGGGGGTVTDRRWLAGPGETTIDEFNDESLSGAWARVDGTGAAAGNVAWTEGGDTLSSRRIAANTGNKLNGIVRSIGTAPATGDAWVTCVTQFGQLAVNYMMAGLVISDGTTHGAGKQVIAELLAIGGTTAISSSAIILTNWDTAGGTGSTARSNPALGTPTFLRLVYKGSSQWRADTSPNGVEWILGASLVTQPSFTPSHVGMYSRDGASGTLCVSAYEFLRRVSGVS